MKRTLVKLFLIGLVIQLAACSGIPKRNWPIQEGRVLDQDTEQPIEGALVVALWKGVVMSHTQCFHVEIDETDADGRYAISAWRNMSDMAYSDNQRIELVAYKAEYEPGGRYSENVEYLKNQIEKGNARLLMLKRYVRLAACGADGENQKKKLVFHEQLYNEAKSVLKEDITSDDQGVVKFLADIVRRQSQYE